MTKKYLKTVRNQVKKEIVFDEDALYSKIKTDDNFQEVNKKLGKKKNTVLIQNNLEELIDSSTKK